MFVAACTLPHVSTSYVADGGFLVLFWQNPTKCLIKHPKSQRCRIIYVSFRSRLYSYSHTQCIHCKRSVIYGWGFLWWPTARAIQWFMAAAVAASRISRGRFKMRLTTSYIKTLLEAVYDNMCGSFNCNWNNSEHSQDNGIASN